MMHFTRLAQSLLTKATTAMQFAACVVLLLQLFCPKFLEKHSCEADGSFVDDTGLMAYMMAFIFRFFTINMITGQAYYSDGKAKIAQLPSVHTMLKAEAKSTDCINTFTTIYFLNFSGISNAAQLSIKNSLMALAFMAPAYDLLIGKTGLREKIDEKVADITWLQNFVDSHKISVRGRKFFDGTYSGLNLASTIIMIVQFMINLGYDSVHENDYPHTQKMIAIFAALAAIIGFNINCFGNKSIKLVLTKLQSALDSFYYPFANMAAMITCANPEIIEDITRFEQSGYQFMVGIGVVSVIVAVLDYFTHRPPESYKELEKVTIYHTGQQGCLAEKPIILRFLLTFFADGLTGYRFIEQGVEYQPLL
jgi:hypothetical protein